MSWPLSAGSLISIASVIGAPAEGCGTTASAPRLAGRSDTGTMATADTSRRSDGTTQND